MPKHDGFRKRIIAGAIFVYDATSADIALHLKDDVGEDVGWWREVRLTPTRKRTATERRDRGREQRRSVGELTNLIVEKKDEGI